jgi:adenosylcobinamide amidohydrolase
MTQKEFIELSEKEVLELNGSKNESVREAWRDGFIYAQKIVRKSLHEDFNDEFMTKMEELSEVELGVFK